MQFDGIRKNEHVWNTAWHNRSLGGIISMIRILILNARKFGLKCSYNHYYFYVAVGDVRGYVVDLCLGAGAGTRPGPSVLLRLHTVRVRVDIGCRLSTRCRHSLGSVRLLSSLRPNGKSALRRPLRLLRFLWQGPSLCRHRCLVWRYRGYM